MPMEGESKPPLKRWGAGRKGGAVFKRERDGFIGERIAKKRGRHVRVKEGRIRA